MGYSIVDVEGIGPAFQQKLKPVGIDTTDDFLSKCADPNGRKSIANETGISEKLLLTWANRADLMRITGVGPQYSELLEAAGVDTVKELRNRNAVNLAISLAETNGVQKLAGNSPASSQVQEWIDEAKTMEPRISH